MPVRAGWVPCVGFQPLKPMMMVINEADAIASECEAAFRLVRPEEQPTPSSESPSPGKRVFLLKTNNNLELSNIKSL